MNNFRNPYVDPDSFQGKVYDYYRNPTNANHLTVDNQDENNQKETKQWRKYKQHDKTQKTAIFTNPRLEKVNNSKPVMFTPPKVDSIEKPLKENTSDELSFNIASDKNTHIEKKGREEVVSNLVKEFSLILEDTSSIQEEITTLPESKFDSESLLNSSESTSTTENNLDEEYTNDPNGKDVSPTYVHEKYKKFNDEESSISANKNNGTLEDEFLNLLLAIDESQAMNEESDEPYNDVAEDETFFAVYSESSELQGEKVEKPDSDKTESELDMLNENIDTIVDKFLTELSENDETDEKKQDGPMDREDEDTFEESTDAMVEKFITLLSETGESEAGKQHSNINEAAAADIKEVEDEQLFRKNLCFTDINEKEKTVTVKLPVLLTELETEIDIIETIDLSKPLNNIVKIEWSIHSLDCKVAVPSKTAFLKGEFIATCEFSNKESENKIQALKFFIPWSKTVNINWVTVPDFPFSKEKEFIFLDQHQHNANNHYEFHQKFSEPIQSQLKKVHFVWHQELNSTEKQLLVNGVAQLSIHFMQDQYIDLDCYSK